MNVLLQGLLTDLLQRCGRLKQEITSPHLVTDEIRDYQEWISKHLSAIETMIKEIQQDPDIEVKALAKHFLHKYKRLAERVHYLEWGPILAISRFSERDKFLTLACKKIAEEISYPWAPPLCVALSSRHYWTNPGFNIIMIPIIEPFHLLGLSDLYHELGHIIISKKEILNIFKAKVDHFYNLETKRIKKENKPKEYIDVISSSAVMWKTNWALEFASDMIATYLAGPAFAWANIRLCINLSDDLFALDPETYHTHPADDARNEGINKMLEIIGIEEMEISIIREMWNKFVDLSGESKPQDYDLRFPQQLIAELAKFIHGECQKLKLTPYMQQKSNPTDFNFTLLLNAAWEKFNNSAAIFPGWELEHLEKIKKLLSKK